MNLTVQTLESLTILNNMGWPRENSYGFYSHWTDRNANILGEFSTIDTAILALGAQFAKNFFSKYYAYDNRIGALADRLLTTVNWKKAIQGLPDKGMYMISNGDGTMSAVTAPYNEYYLLAYIAQKYEIEFAAKNNTKCQEYFDKAFGYFDEPEGISGSPVHTNFKGYEMLSDTPNYKRFYAQNIVKKLLIMNTIPKLTL